MKLFELGVLLLGWKEKPEATSVVFVVNIEKPWPR